MAEVFSWPARVYFHETDAGGVVFHGNYLHFMEASRTEFLQSLGFSVRALREGGEALFVVYRLEMNFIQPAQLHDSLQITASLDHVGRARLGFEQKIMRDGETLVDAKVHIASVDPRTLKPVPLPETLRERALARQRQ
jgi:acyl-CoA thioester hydrolase